MTCVQRGGAQLDHHAMGTLLNRQGGRLRLGATSHENHQCAGVRAARVVSSGEGRRFPASRASWPETFSDQSAAAIDCSNGEQVTGLQAAQNAQILP